MYRRDFLGAALAAGLSAQDTPPDWGGPVLDFHLHPKQGPEGEWRHMQGSGITKAVLLAGGARDEKAKQLVAAHPDRFVRFSSTDMTRPDALDVLRQAHKSGAIGFGELKSHVDADGPEMKRLYDMAAELGVPVLMHFAEVEQFPGEGTFNRNIRNLAAVLKAHKKTTFIGHADAFWANISNEPITTPYPTGPVKRGGLTDKLLGEFANLWGDCSANSCRNALNRDPEFTAAFLARHRNKLIFGSDCSCTDGRGQGQRSEQPLIKGKCVARETLAVLKKHCSAEAFRKIAWRNGHTLLKLKA